MKGSAYTLIYAAVLALVCATALTAVDRFTTDRKAANAAAEETRNMLGVLDVPFDEHASAAELLATFEEKVTEVKEGELTFYVYEHPEAGTLWAARFQGQALWAPVEGLLCLKADRRTIYGISFYKQEETPGLGGEISADWFQEQFVGKVIVDDAGEPGVRIVRDGADGGNEVDAISGATMTCDKVEDMLNVLIVKLVAEEGADGR